MIFNYLQMVAATLMIGSLSLRGQAVIVEQANLTEPSAGPNLAVGDRYSVSISSPSAYAPIAAVSALGAFVAFAYTDSKGSWSATATARNVGIYSITYYVSGVAAPSLNFRVIAERPTVQQSNLTVPIASPNLAVGDLYTVSISSPFPNAGITSVSALGIFRNFAFTDSSGNWSATATARNVGTYSETYYVNGFATQPLNFSVVATSMNIGRF